MIEQTLVSAAPVEGAQEVPTDEPEDFGTIGEPEAAPTPALFNLRAYQAEAADAVATELSRSGSARTILQMACRCGKTPVSYRVAQALRAQRILCLVPGLHLLRQTAQKIAAYANQERVPMLLVGSDANMTTDVAAIRRFCAADHRAQSWVICTYQSSPLLAACDFAKFDLTIFDEAHRTCGGRAPRPFNSLLAKPGELGVARASLGRQLFMTATPAYEPLSDQTISMRDRDLFGGVAFRYYLRQGIAAGYVNDFRLELILTESGAPDSVNVKGAPDSTKGTDFNEEQRLAAAIIEAMARVDKLLVFCRNIKSAERLAERCRSIMPQSPHTAFECSVAHSRMPAGSAAAALRRFAAPGVRAALFNCRMLQEGVEVAPLNAVFFAAPRSSPRDIIQSICRPLNAAPGKPQSVIFLPLAHDAREAPDAPANLQRYAAILPFVDALLDEDPQLFERLISGDARVLNVTGGGQSPAALSAVRAAAYRVVRHGTAKMGGRARAPERLLRADAIPWDRAYAELRRVVTDCRRYPKTTDEWVVSAAGASAGAAARVNLHAIYGGMAARYSGRSLPPLEPYQRAALEALPGWLPWGAEGPYAWGPCIAYLEQWLETRGIGSLALEINKGGYVGLEATGMERLSGALTCVNQQVFGKRVGRGADAVVHTANRVPAGHAADLDRVCARFGLRWRKEFLADGTVDPSRPTFIQEAYSRFKAMYARAPDHPYIREHFPGYPLKHARQCALDLLQSDALPPRRSRKKIVSGE